MFFSMAPWCPACKSFKETWEEFAGWGHDLDISVGVVDVTENPGKVFVRSVHELTSVPEFAVSKTKSVMCQPVFKTFGKC
jgi:glutaredoxin